MDSGVVARSEFDEEEAAVLEQHGGALDQVALLRRLVEVLSSYLLAPSARTALWSIRQLCERARLERWVPANERDILKAYAESVGGCADRWLNEMAEYESAIAAGCSVLESVGWDWARGRMEGRAQRMTDSAVRVQEHARRLQLASVELAKAIEREALRAGARLRFMDPATRRRWEDVGAAARALRFEVPEHEAP